MLTSATLGGVFVTAFILFAIANFLFWMIEVLAATIRSVFCWFMKKPCNWHVSYYQVRVILTRILLRFSFAFVPPKEAFLVSQDTERSRKHRREHIQHLRKRFRKR